MNGWLKTYHRKKIKGLDSHLTSYPILILYTSNSLKKSEGFHCCIRRKLMFNGEEGKEEM